MLSDYRLHRILGLTRSKMPLSIQTAACTSEVVYETAKDQKPECFSPFEKKIWTCLSLVG